MSKRYKVPTGMVIEVGMVGFEKFKSTGNPQEYQVLCPFHDDSHPSATFNIKSGLFYCFTCGMRSNAWEIAEDLGGSVEFVFRSGLRKSDDKTMGEVIDNWRTLLTSPLATGNEYMQKRGVNDNLIKRYKIFEYEHGIGFPITNMSNNVVGLQVRQYHSDHSKYLFYGKTLPIWPLPDLDDLVMNDRIFLTEGVFGALRAKRAGIFGFALMGAGRITPQLGAFLGYLNVFGVMDADDAGFLASAKLTTLGIPCLKDLSFVADEAENKQWREIGFDPYGHFTISPTYFIEKHSDPDKVAELVSKFRRSIYE